MMYWDEAESISRSLASLSHALDAAVEESPAQTSSKATTHMLPCSQGSRYLLKSYADLSRVTLSRLFLDDAAAERLEGGSGDDDAPFPMLSQHTANTRILRSLRMIEERLLHNVPSTTHNDTSPTVETAAKVGLESILYLPALGVIALEARCIALRRRVKASFHAIQARGFVVAKTGLQDFELAWTATAPGLW